MLTSTKNTTVLILFLLLGMNIYAQSAFQKGYFIKNNGSRLNVMIKNNDWLGNPTSFRYKTDENSKIKTLTISDVKEFSVGDAHKYVRFTVDIDRSKNRESDLSKKRKPEFSNETLFLKVLVEGTAATLYGYREGSLSRFFYKSPTQKIEQLIFKKYITEQGKIRTNDLYKKQLIEKLFCPTLSKVPSYNTNSLVKYFLKYNRCKDESKQPTDFTFNKTKSVIQVKIKAGNTFRYGVTYNNRIFGDSDFVEESTFSPRAAVELEYKFPFDNNRLAIFGEVAYYSYSGTATFIVGSETANPLVTNSTDIDISGIEIPLGVRYYLPLANANKIFINGGIAIDNPSPSNGEELDTNSSIFFGAGYEFQSKFNIEFRYNTSKDLEYTDTKLTSEFGYFSVQVAYTIF